MENQRNRNSERAFWGLLLVVGAVALIVNRFGFLRGISIWTIILTIGFGALLIDGIKKRNIGCILFPIAFLIIIHDDFLGLERITPFPVLGAALLGTIGLQMMFPKLSGHYYVHSTGTEMTRENGKVKYDNHFGGSVKYLNGEISHVDIDSDFGTFELYLTEATLVNNTATVKVDSAFGEVKLYVPASWKVVLNVEHAMAAVDEYGSSSSYSDMTLYIVGEVSFGHLAIYYV